ncbi:hypothetical protein A2526_00495 [candidate division WOR-1 bacterium RIFOXYD2_FULL_36_8]|uniref:Type II secretion system protein GspI C-terminal domain-containing protein n=1 Tax=candidate division WOR-1 bacterium RIFOXYB2_FULL_36_35 TaxID=1802578 RepID=A0A1F4S5W0_UNCSA|nr:MAG: hypothetical protein A2230_02260 [candidate division WOR-1 bacterium RIFOXYA2_FULL_36_21]OGC15825.1 MAG: hypothetical protein A2290_05765 [candidate division WOR-1 bacterium RIFOXYB2_FULL_36_35]OGC15913.1 MAG: hypothetical protein A2282_04945 [candidate division WOR-1 bacterium RIFOXYA12_FULL_36_13]OGC41681.1 MAG: hypothetical protein A2526_00495 [candidate division WOR-1 bacterium RIFOXYD2_FULL_36_8]
MNKKGFTLIELIVAIMVIIVAFMALISVFTGVMPKGIALEFISKSTYLANLLIEEDLSKDFYSISSVSPTNFSSPFDKFSYEIVVDFVTTAEPDVVSANGTNFKRVKARVWSKLSPTIEVVTLVTTYESL